VDLRQEDIQGRGTIDAAVFQQKRQHLQQVRFTRPEEARHPHAIGAVIVGVSVKKVLQALGDLVGQHILAQLVVQAGFIISLDHPFNRTTDGVQENAVEFHLLLPQA